MHLHRGFFMPIFSTMHMHRAFLCPYERKLHGKSAFFPERSTINLEFCASGVPLIGVLIANGKAQAVTDTSWASWPAIDAGAILAGMVSGLASTGLHQAFKQLVGDN